MLTPIEDKLPEIRTLARKLKLALYKIETTPLENISYDKWLNPFIVKFYYPKPESDIYVENDTLFIPTMSAKKLNGLVNFFTEIGSPFALEHEICHLLDIEETNTKNLCITAEEYENRATKVEELLEKESYASTANK